MSDSTGLGSCAARSAQETQQEGDRQHPEPDITDPRPAHAVREQYQGNARQRQRVLHQRQRVAGFPSPVPCFSHFFRKAAMALRKSGVARDTALTRAPSFTPSSKLSPSSW